MPEPGKPYELLLKKGKNPVRDNDGSEGKGKTEKANAFL